MGTVRRGETFPPPARHGRFAPVRVRRDPYAGFHEWMAQAAPIVEAALSFGLSRSTVFDVFMRANERDEGADIFDWITDALADAIHERAKP